MLGLEGFLKRKPRALSGGQRQRVAMGRAIVREPQAFLMDEPLSNLDAKLRVQMRAEIAKLQSDLGTTTVYVTHDQIEAMTMGDRVAVMRKGELQQVAAPQELYDRPVNLFVGGFIGSPAMNLVEAKLERANGGLAAVAGGEKIVLGDETLSARPALKEYQGREVILGIRPEDLEDAALAVDATSDRQLSGEVELTEALGSEVMVHFTIDAQPAMTDEVRELAEGRGRRRAARGGAASGGADDARRPLRRPFEGPQGRADQGGRRHARLALLRSRHGARDLRRNERGRLMKRQRKILLGLILVLGLVLLAAGCGGDDDEAAGTTAAAATTAEENVSGSVSVMGIWVGEEQKSFQAVVDGFKDVQPDVTVKYNPVGDNLPTVLGTAVQGGNPPDIAAIAQPGLMTQFVDQGSCRLSTSRRTPSSRTSVNRSWTPERWTARSTASSGRPTTHRPSGTTSRRSRTPGSSLQRRGTTSCRAGTRSSSRACRRTRSPEPTAGRSPTSSRTSTCGRGSREVRPALEARDPVDRRVGQGSPDRDGEGLQLERQSRRRYTGALQTDFPTSVTSCD